MKNNKRNNQTDELPTVRNYVAKHMNSLCVPAVEIDKKKQAKSGNDKKHKQKIFGDY